MNLELVTEGLQFPEGPIAMSDGSVIVVEIERQTLTRVNPDGTQDIIAHIEGGPNGAAIGPDGAVYICNNGGFNWHHTSTGITVPAGMADNYKTGSIQRVDLTTGNVETLYESCDGRALRGPNDIVFDQEGGFWFTDHGKGNGDWAHVGHVLYAKPDGSLISRVRDHMHAPNGIGLSPDQKTLHVAETPTSRVWNFDIESPGKIGPLPGHFDPQPVYGPLPGHQFLDSLAIDAEGNVCVATLFNGGITVFGSDGSMVHHAVPDPMVTNICFGGDDMQDAWITASGAGKLYKCRWPTPGLRLNYNA